LVVLLAAPVHTNHAIGTGIEDVERVSKTTTIRTRLSLIVLALEAMVVGGLIVNFIHEFI